MTALRRTLATLVLAVAVAPAPADAQIGGFIKKKVADRVADKVRGDGGDAKGAAITDDAVRRLVASLDEESKWRDREEAPFRRYEAELAAYEREQRESQACMDRANGRADGAARTMAATQLGGSAAMLEWAAKMDALPEDKREALEARQERMTERAEAALARGDTVAAGKIALEMRADMERTVGAKMPAGTLTVEQQATMKRDMATVMRAQEEAMRCPQVTRAAPQRPASRDANADSLRAAIVATSGLPAREYAVLRERVGAWAAVRAKGSHPTSGFSQEELAVLEEHEEALMKRRGVLLAENVGTRLW